MTIIYCKWYSDWWSVPHTTPHQKTWIIPLILWVLASLYVGSLRWFCRWKIQYRFGLLCQTQLRCQEFCFSNRECIRMYRCIDYMLYIWALMSLVLQLTFPLPHSSTPASPARLQLTVLKNTNTTTWVIKLDVSSPAHLARSLPPSPWAAVIPAYLPAHAKHCCNLCVNGNSSSNHEEWLRSRRLKASD